MNTINKIYGVLFAMLIAFTLQAQEANFIPGQMLIKMKSDIKAQKTSLKSQSQAKTLKTYPNLNIELWEVKQANGKQATLALIEQYKNHPDVEFAEPNYLWQAIQAIGGTEPNDPYFSQLWALNNTGQNGGTEDADIDAPEAYCMPVSALDVVVGVIDTGVDYTHEDLAENMWQNLGEDINGNGKVLIKNDDGDWIFDPGDENGIDDDGNGYIDDFVGWDFVYNDNDPTDFYSHGTHCAGTIGAVTNNNIGINGVAPNAKLAALKFLADDGFGSTADAVDALNYAVAMGIPITNNSWGGGAFSTAMYQAIQNAEANNHLFIAAAGNNNLDNDQYPHFPSSYDNANIIAVASTDKNDNRSDFSNYGLTSVDIGAPGSEIFSCIPGNGYKNKRGTSMATPHVAGVCAFLLGANPGSNYSTIKNALINADNNLTALNGKCVSGGRLNLHDALVEMGAPANPCDDVTPVPPAVCNRSTDSLTLVALYNSITNVETSTNWDLANSIEDWQGVQLDEDGCVHSVRLYPNFNVSIVGSIPTEIGNFSRLKSLRIETDDFSGPIPSSIGNLTTLEELNLRIENNTGSIPQEIYQLTKLKRLSLYGPFTGSISSNIQNLIDLEELRFIAGYDNNHLDNLTGVIPAEIGNLTKLKTISFAFQTFSGGIPAEFSNLINLEYLHLRDNNLSGNINWLGNLVSLIKIDILDNQFSGSIPSSIGNLQNIKNLSLSHNQLNEEIPDEICNCFSLEIIGLSGNELSGIIPSCIGQLSKLNYLNLRANQITGNIPEEIGFLSELTYLELGYNQLQGTLPSTFGSLDQLKSFSVINNNLGGCFPNQLVSLCRDSLNLEYSPWPPDFNHFNEGNNFDATWEDFCANGTGSCGPLVSQVWPGDFDNNGVAEINDLLYWGIANTNKGVTRPNATTNWNGQDCDDWSGDVNGINYKHQDGDGDGLVNEQDLLALIQNFGESHSFSEPDNLVGSYQMKITPNGVLNGANDGLAFEYLLEVSDNGNPINAHGICASVFFGNLKVAHAEADLSGSSLQADEHLENFNAASNTYQICLTRNDGINQPVTNLARILVQVLDEPDSGVSFALDVKSGIVMQANGTLEKTTGATTVDTYGINADPALIALSTSTSHANCENGGAALVNALGGSGNYCYQWNTGETTQQITNLSPGIYSVLVCDDYGASNSIDVEVQGQFIPIYDEDGDILPCNTATSASRPSGMFIGQAQINGFPAEEGDRLVAFDPNGNVVGMDLLSLSSGIAYVNMPIFGDESSGVGAYFTLQIYDASADAYYDYETGGQVFEFTGWENTNGVPMAAYSNSDVVYSFGGCNQSINLNAGWNLISFNNNATDNTVTAVFADLIAAGNLEFITGFDNVAKVFDPNQPPFLNTITAIDDGFGYWVKITNSSVLTSAGTCVPVNTKPLDAGWNLIAYTSSTPQAPSDYFADLIADGNLIFVSGFDDVGYKIFDPYGPPFLNSLTQLQNGFGYWVKVTNASAKTANNFTNVFSFINGTSNLPNGEQVTVLNEAGETIAIMEVIKDGYLMTTAIYGDDETTALKENIYIGEKLQFSWNNQIIDFSTTFKGDYGIEKVHLEFKLVAGLTSSINIFPNPLADEASIVYNLEKSDEVSVTLFNANGQQLKTLVKNQTQQSGQHQITLNANDLPNGIYYLQLIGSEISIYKKIVVNK